MSLHVVVGAGPVGSGTAQLLAEAGHRVRLVSRSGRNPHPNPRIEPVSADATDAAGLAELARGAAALYNCANPPYARWPTDWPPIADALLRVAEQAGAVLVTMSNLYGYGPLNGPVTGPLTEDTPLAATGRKGRVRAGMWIDALAAHRAGRARVTEARAADFFGPQATRHAMLGDRFVRPVLAGRPAYVLGDPDAPHTWSYLPDVAAAMAILGTDSRAWGRAWHVPSPPAMSQREVARRLADLAGVRNPRLRRIPNPALRAVGLFSPTVREFQEVRHQFVRPFEMDSSAFTATFGMPPTPMDEALKATVAWWQNRTGA